MSVTAVAAMSSLGVFTFERPDTARTRELKAAAGAHLLATHRRGKEDEVTLCICALGMFVIPNASAADKRAAMGVLRRHFEATAVAQVRELTSRVDRLEWRLRR